MIKRKKKREKNIEVAGTVRKMKKKRRKKASGPNIDRNDKRIR